MSNYQINNDNAKPSFTEWKSSNEIDCLKNTNTKKRKADLTCVICGGQAIGYNFSQISCESCKAFFRRNALQPIEKTKCINYNDNVLKVRCNIRYDNKHKCQRCRLLKCFEEGMRKDFILTPEKKQLKKQRLEENRRLSSELMNKNYSVTIQDTNKCTPTRQITSSFANTIPHSSKFLSPTDWHILSHIQNVYFIASQSTPSASSVISFELPPDKMSTFRNTLDIQHFTAIKLINFLREIPEFKELNQEDRLILVKYNLILLLITRASLNFDSKRELSYDIDTNHSISPADEAFAEYCKSLYILCYGYEFNRNAMSIFHVLSSIVNKDPVITQLLMLVTIFSKGVSANYDQEPVLNDTNHVFNAQSKYIDLLFRYLMEQFSFETVVTKMIRIVEQLLKIQKFVSDFQNYIRNNIDSNYINPLMKSLFHLT